MKTDHQEEEGDKNKNKPTSKPPNHQTTTSQGINSLACGVNDVYFPGLWCE
jgi:hypothetical protein